MPRSPFPTRASAAGLCLLLSVSAAAAAERTGSTEIDIDGRRIAHSFSVSEDPASGMIRRTGTVTLGDDRTFSYEISGTCLSDRSRCDLAGSGTGPGGRRWTGSGILSRAGTVTTVTATVTGPAGRTLTLVRKTEGDPLVAFFP